MRRDPVRGSLPWALLGSVSLLAYAGLAVLSHRPEHVPLVAYFTVLAWVWLVLGAAFLLTGSPQGSPDRAPVWILLFGLGFRIVGLFAAPVLEDDPARYLWDGWVFAQLGTPYGVAPSAWFGDASVPAVMQRVLDQVNHPDVPTIYGPVCQYLFLGASRLALGDLLPLKLGLLAGDLLVFFLLRNRLSTRGALLYLWSPLVVLEVAFNAHIDVLGIGFLVLSFLLLAEPRGPEQGRPGSRRRIETAAWFAGLAAAVAVGAKVLALGLLPLLVQRAHRVGGGRTSVTLAVGFLLGLAGLYVPFLLRGGDTELASWQAFASRWEFNSLGFAAVAALASPGAARVAGPLLAGAVLCLDGWQWGRRRRQQRRDVPAVDRSDLPRGDWIYGTLLFFAPVLNPWYVLWVWPFVALRPSLTGVLAAAIVPISYLHGGFLAGGGLAAYHHPSWVRIVEALVILAALAWDLSGVARRTPRRGPIGFMGSS